MSNPCLILEWSAASDWPCLHTGEPQHAGTTPGPKRIDPIRQPTILHPTREIAEAEAKRLAARHPGKQFAIFEAVLEARMVQIHSHVTVGGQVYAHRSVAALLAIDDDRVPF